MTFHPRTESRELKIMSYLNSRMTLSANDKLYYTSLKKGYQGEQQFDGLVQNLSDNWLILNDLTFEHNHSTFQIDSLLISGRTIHPFEIKNYAGDFYIKDDIWYTISGKEIKNPVLQLKRTESLLRSMLQDLKSDYTVDALVIFINPEFTLYHAPMDLPIILPSQLNRLFKSLHLRSSRIKKDQLRLANQLLSMQVHESSYTKTPKYDYGQLQKGILCGACSSLSVNVYEYICVCNRCGFKEDFETAFLRSIEEFETLFPDKKITTNAIYDWCQPNCSRRSLQRLLAKHFRAKGGRRYTYYVRE